MLKYTHNEIAALRQQIHLQMEALRGLHGIIELLSDLEHVLDAVEPAVEPGPSLPAPLVKRDGTLESFSDALATFSRASGVNILPPAPGEGMVPSMLRVFAHVLDALTSTVVGSQEKASPPVRRLTLAPQTERRL